MIKLKLLLMDNLCWNKSVLILLYLLLLQFISHFITGGNRDSLVTAAPRRENNSWLHLPLMYVVPPVVRYSHPFKCFEYKMSETYIEKNSNSDDIIYPRLTVLLRSSSQVPVNYSNWEPRDCSFPSGWQESDSNNARSSLGA